MRRSACELVALAALAVGGCMTPHITDPPRSATEQLLISTAADEAMAKIDLEALSGRAVFVDATNVEGTDKAYLVGAIAERVNAQGARLAADKEKAEVVVAVRTGALSVDRSQILIGIPQLLLPMPFGGTLKSPEVAIFKTENRRGFAKVGVHAYEVASGKHLLSIGPVSGLSRYDLRTIIGVTWSATNIPEKR